MEQLYKRKLHVRGDGPTAIFEGWCDFLVNPTHVGVDQWWTISPPTSEGNPHTRGDGPKYPDLPKKLFQQAPRAWGWTELNAVDSPRRRW